ncbi:MAG: hypothetical protein HS116_22090 [Planctomycetes bacterium]|nr:hypothetical protein [Planctomycetota bacterium]
MQSEPAARDEAHRPLVVVLPEAWSAVTCELDRAAEEGRRLGRSPREAVFVPLCALKYRAGCVRVPRMERTSLEDLAAVVVVRALRLPDAWVEASAARIRFRDGAGIQNRFDALLDTALHRYGRLEVLARGHSHPFDVGGTRPSGIDRVEHLAPCLAYNRALGLDAGFTFIAVQGRGGARWALHCFGSKDGDRIIDLGLAALPAASGTMARLAKAPFFQTPEGAALEAVWRASHGGAMRVDRLPLGWTRIRLGDPVTAVFALPPGYPQDPGVRFWLEQEAWQREEIQDWSALPACNIQPGLNRAS